MVVHLLVAPQDRAQVSVPGISHPRVGLVVSRAVGNAVTRNLVKRRLRHLARERVGLLSPGSLLVVRALPASAAASYPELGQELDRCLSKVGVR